VWEEADGLAALAETYGYTHEEIAKKISKSRTTVTESMTIAGIPQKIREKCREGNISAKSTLLEVARQFDDAAMLNFLQNITSKGLKREEVRTAARPQTKNSGSKEPKSPSPKVIQEQEQENVFKYSSSNNSFQLEIKFLDKNQFVKKDILQALKEAFDSVKASSQ